MKLHIMYASEDFLPLVKFPGYSRVLQDFSKEEYIGMFLLLLLTAVWIHFVDI